MDVPHRRWLSFWRKSLTAIAQECYELYWTNPGGNIPQNNCHLPPISKTIQIRRTRYAGHWWRSEDKLINDVLLWTPSHGRASAGRSARIYLCTDTGWSLEDLPEAMNDRDQWREGVREILVRNKTWWWWHFPQEQFKEYSRDNHMGTGAWHDQPNDQ